MASSHCPVVKELQPGPSACDCVAFPGLPSGAACHIARYVVPTSQCGMRMPRRQPLRFRTRSTALPCGDDSTFVTYGAIREWSLGGVLVWWRV